MPPSRAELGAAIGCVLFKKLSQQDIQRLFKEFTAAGWAEVKFFTSQALTSEIAAKTLSTHFLKNVGVMHSALEPQMYFGGSTPTVADVACYIALIPVFASFSDEYKWALANASRWFDMMQHSIGALAPPPELGLGEKMVAFNFNLPDELPTAASLAPIKVFDLPGSSDAAPAAAAAAAGGGGAAEPAAQPTGGEDAEAPKEGKKKEKKEKKEKPPAAAPAAPAAAAIDVSWADFKVGKIVEAKAHPDSDKLYIETIEVGEEKPRQILSGLAQHMKLEEVQGAMVVIIANLKTRKIGGIESQGMVLCAGNADKSCLGFVTPPAGAAPGERVMFEGFDGPPEAPTKMDKKKGWETIQPELRTTADGVCCWKELPFTLASGACTASVKGGNIS